jgi:hypothetical protein
MDSPAGKTGKRFKQDHVTIKTEKSKQPVPFPFVSFTNYGTVYV